MRHGELELQSLFSDLESEISIKHEVSKRITYFTRLFWVTDWILVCER